MTCCASCLRPVTSLSCPACIVAITRCRLFISLSLPSITSRKSAICFSYLAGFGSWNNAPIRSTAFVVASTATPFNLSVLISRRVCVSSDRAASRCACKAAISTDSVCRCSLRCSTCSAISFLRTNTSR